MAPFVGVRFQPGAVPDLASAISPPYDVIDAEGVAHLEQLDPHNVVRLILPREDTSSTGSTRGAGSGRYRHAASTLARWFEEGVLGLDPRPAFYVYEQQKAEMVLRGLFAAVELRDPDERVVLPHEDVMPGPVADRLELMRATAANLEPILLVYDGGGATAGLIASVVQTPPLVGTTTEDGITHRLWAVEDDATQEIIAADLAPRQALIADGHHRYETSRRLQAEHRAAADGPGPWDLCLALLVDSRTDPLDVQAIHRVIDGLDLTGAIESAARVFSVVQPCSSREEALVALESASGSHPFLLTDGLIDGSTWVLISDPAAAAVAAALAPPQPELWRRLDASVLHALLLEHLWRIPDGSPRTHYVHGVDDAVRTARASAGTAVLMRPVGVEEVHAVAAQGERMPRKSTSFGPKPRSGLVLRLLTP